MNISKMPNSPKRSARDTVYPEAMSRLHKRMIPKQRRGGSSRYHTLPVTFSEIQEVDEENTPEDVPSEVPVTSKSELNLLNKKFDDSKKTGDNFMMKLKKEDALLDIPSASSRCMVLPRPF